VLGVLAVSAARAAEPVEAFPSRPIRIVVPFTPGGGTDLIARKLQPGMQERLGQTVVVENRPGGNARIGANTVAKAEPDGYTVLLTTSGAFVIVPLLGKVAYDPLKDFAPVTLPATAAAVGTRTTVIVDGGIRRGSDIVKALALGAKAVMIGRATLYGTTVAGEAGVAKALALRGREYAQTLAYVGCRNAGELTGDIFAAEQTAIRTSTD
jgi:hypothetical protein